MRNSSSDRAIFHEDCEREHQFSPRHSENRTVVLTAAAPLFSSYTGVGQKIMRNLTRITLSAAS